MSRVLFPKGPAFCGKDVKDRSLGKTLQDTLSDPFRTSTEQGVRPKGVRPTSFP